MSFGTLNFRVSKPAADNTKENSSSTSTGKLADSKLHKTRKSSGKHQPAACCACKKKRKKCDGRYPICSACENAGVECTVFDQTINRRIPRNHIEKLENKTKSLEEQVCELKKFIDDKINYPELKNTNQVKSKGKSLETDVGYITLGAASEPMYMGNSSAFSIARAITNSINYYKPGSSSRLPVSKERCNGYQSGLVVPELPQVHFIKPSIEDAKRLLDNYYTSVQYQYPFLDWDEISLWLVQVFIEDDRTPKKEFFIYMILAISTQIQSETSHKTQFTQQKFTFGNYIKTYYDKAFQNIEQVLEVSNLCAVQAYLLLAVFSQKMPEAASIWQLIGLAIRSAVTLGLHRKSYYSIGGDSPSSGSTTKESKLNSRVFWSTYSLERINGIILGRPFGISDIDIDVSLPNDPEIPVACHVFKLRKIQSDISTFVYKPKPFLSNDPKEVDATRVGIVLELNDWMNTFPAKQNPVSRFESYNWCSISYHNSMLLLLRPVVLEVSRLGHGTPPRLFEWFKVFAHSASSICLNYKELHLKSSLHSTWLMMHCLFVAGISFLYCVWIDRSLHVLNFRTSKIYFETVSACSNLLYIIAERWNTATVFRDTFEDLSRELHSKFDTDPEVNGASMNEDPFKNIQIDQYLSFDNRVWESDQSEKMSAGSPDSLEQRSVPKPKPITSQFSLTQQPPADIFGSREMDISVWEFLDTTGDKFLRDIYQDMERNLKGQ